MSNILRRNFKVRTADGIDVAIREVRLAGESQEAVTPIVLLHGTRVPGVSEYDLPVANGSLAEEFAMAGHVCYILDARGFGRSDRPATMENPASQSAPYARCMQIVRDVNAAVDDLISTQGKPQVALMGWGVGATAVLMHAAIWPEKISHVILYNILYGGGIGHARYKDQPLEDPENPGHFNQRHYGGYSLNDPEMLLQKWDQSIPIDDKDQWRDPEIAAAFAQALLDGDPSSGLRTPRTYRSPNGMLEDSFYIGKGDKLVAANQVYANVMIIRPELDYFSRTEDVATLAKDLVNARSVKLWEPRNATHFVILDRPERGRTETISQMVGFLSATKT